MTTQTTLEVRDMTCGACVRHVTEALRVPGVAKVDVRLRDGLVAVEHDATAASVPALIAALSSAGYPARVHAGAVAPKRAGGCCCG